MIDKSIIDLVESRTKIAQRDLIEKDLILHRLLVELESNDYFKENYAFKGGTCLMKCYIDYYRFSEDLDFTFINQAIFEHKTKGQAEKLLSKETSNISDMLKSTSDKIGLDFKSNKRDRHYFEFGGSNRFVTFKLWYVPEGQTEETFIKIQVNFIEKLEFPITEKHTNNIFFGRHKDFELAFLLPENSEWVLKTPKLKCYDIREVLIEKVRAILTRRGVKARDFIDVYMIEKAKKLKVQDFKKQIIDKTRYMLKFEKYRKNLDAKSEFKLEKEAEKRILFDSLPDDFDFFLRKFNVFLKEIVGAKELAA